MEPRTKSEIQKAQRYLQSNGSDKEGALRGLNDWFWQGMIEDNLMPTGDEWNGHIVTDEAKLWPLNIRAANGEQPARGDRYAELVARRGHPKFYQLLNELADLHERKNQNYATQEDPLSNLRECEGLGIDAFKGTLVRLCDKWCRIKNLAKGVPDLVGESIVDTLRDMAIYSLLAIILWEEKHPKKENE